MKTFLSATAALAIAACAFSSAMAQAPAGPSVREACAADMQKLCAGLERPAVRECMRSHMDQVSDGCKAAIAARRASRAADAASPATPGAPTDSH